VGHGSPPWDVGGRGGGWREGLIPAAMWDESAWDGGSVLGGGGGGGACAAATAAAARAVRPAGRGLHSSTFQLNLSRF